MRQSVINTPLPDIFYHILYAIHYDSGNPNLLCTRLHPVDVTALLRTLPLPENVYEDWHHKKFLRLMDDLYAIGCTERQISDFLRIVCAIVVSGGWASRLHLCLSSPFSR